jgi:hypothetical protein
MLKSQTSVFGEGLNLFEFENIFDLDLNPGIKFNYAENNYKTTIYSLCRPGPIALVAQSGF